ncbi:hypothetical protein CH275_09900 [Rhodococcus sp. 06-235-1A]|uniref:hypothetical protein n=1 Tax=Rhodococcus sp. 06-235-1A TaxID=2022508 RepID=UPI000B9A895B|nr:hypothetical protein [Rhodococcus sp. 06-235-1A]OZD06522.1 hypothetical protein CH275_09900 [Rhodococcus sp. 06-235-1A]
MAARTKTSAADKAEARRELAASLHTSITAKVAELTSSDTWRAYLAGYSAETCRRTKRCSAHSSPSSRHTGRC